MCKATNLLSEAEMGNRIELDFLQNIRTPDSDQLSVKLQPVLKIFTLY